MGRIEMSSNAMLDVDCLAKGTLPRAPCVTGLSVFANRSGSNHTHWGSNGDRLVNIQIEIACDQREKLHGSFSAGLELSDHAL